jgi:hypothetical protein
VTSPSGKRGQHHQHQWRAPLRAKEEVHGGVLLVVQRKGKQGKKNGCLEQPQQVFHGSPVVRRFYVAPGLTVWAASALFSSAVKYECSKFNRNCLQRP